MKRSRFFLLHPLWLAAALLTGLMLALTMTSARALPDSPDSASDALGGIEGTLYIPSPGTLKVGDGWIDIHDEQGHAIAVRGILTLAVIHPFARS